MRHGSPKLLVVIGTLAHMGGAERQALYLIDHLKSLEGCSVEVLTSQDGSALRPLLEVLGVPIHVEPYFYRWPRLKRGMAFLRLARVLRFNVKADALLPFGAHSSKIMAQVWPLTKARYCWWNQQDEGRELFGTAEERRVLNCVSCITSNSDAGRDFLIRTYGVPENKILVYNNGTPAMAEFSKLGIWRANLALGDRKIVSMVANITSYKDHATLLEAWVQVRRHFEGSSVPVLLLAGHLGETSIVAKLKAQAFELGLSTNDVRFLGMVENVSALMNESDLVVHSSLTEGCPNAVCEAMAAARAVVATDIPGCRQALGEFGRQWLAEPRNPTDLATKIVKLLKNDNLRTREGVENLKRIQTCFSISGMNRFLQDQIEKGLGCTFSSKALEKK